MKRIIWTLILSLLVFGFIPVSGVFAEDKIETLKKQVAANPNDAEAHFGLGLAYGQLGRNQEAIAELKEAIRLKPDFAEAHLGLGFVYNDLKDGVNAILHMVETEKLFEKSNNVPLLADARKLLREYQAKYGYKAEDFAKAPQPPQGRIIKSPYGRG